MSNISLGELMQLQSLQKSEELLKDIKTVFTQIKEGGKRVTASAPKATESPSSKEIEPKHKRLSDLLGGNTTNTSDSDIHSHFEDVLYCEDAIVSDIDAEVNEASDELVYTIDESDPMTGWDNSTVYDNKDVILGIKDVDNYGVLSCYNNLVESRKFWIKKFIAVKAAYDELYTQATGEDPPEC